MEHMVTAAALTASGQTVTSIRSALPTNRACGTRELDGSAANGQTVSTVVRLIVHPATPQPTAVIPVSFFHAADRQKLIERSRDPKLASLWAHLQTTAKNTSRHRRAGPWRRRF